MPKFLLKPNVTSSLNTILLCGEENSLRNEIADQLIPYKHLTVLDSTGNSGNLDLLKPDVFIYFIPAFISKSKNLKYFDDLISQLKLASMLHSLYILVLNDNSVYGRQTLKYALQIVKQKYLTLKIVEVDHSIPSNLMAQSIVRLFIHDHVLKDNLSPSNKIITGKFQSELHKNIPVKIISLITKLIVNSLALFIGYFISIVLQLCVIGLLINHGTYAFNKHDYSHSSLQMYFASSFSEALLSNVNILIPGYYIERLSGVQLNETLDVINSLSNLTGNLSNTGNYVFKLINSSSEDSFNTNLSDLKNEIALLESNIINFKSDIISIDKSAGKHGLIPDSVINNISNLKAAISKLNYFISQAPQLLGFGKPTTYLFLLQDNSRLFPTGGEIDLIAAMSLEDGKASDVRMYKPSDLDRIFTGTSVPPLDYQQFSGKSTWTLSQMTWNPDFNITADIVTKYITKTLEVKPDVVIGLNLLTFNNLIPYLKHLTFSLNNSAFTYDNFINKHREFSDNKPGDSFFREVFTHIQYQTPIFTSESFSKLLWNIINQSDSRQLFFQPVTGLLTPDNPPEWSGKIFIPNCRSHPPCLQGYLYMTDAMASENPSYFDLTQKNTLDIQISADAAEYYLKTTIINRAEVKNTQTSVSRVYRTIFLPVDIYLLSSKIDDKETIPDKPQFINNSDIRQLGFTINVAPQAESTLEIRYRQLLPQPNNKFRLQVDIPNQPGLTNSSLDINIFYPPSWFSTLFQTPRVASPGTLRYNTPISQPINLDIDFLKR